VPGEEYCACGILKSSTHIEKFSFAGEGFPAEPRLGKHRAAPRHIHHARGETMITLTNVKAELEKLSMLRDRTLSSSSAQKKKAIVRLAPCLDGSISASKFADDRGWKRHRNGEEFVEIIDGATMLNLMMDDGV
jgi:hypothetical protein